MSGNIVTVEEKYLHIQNTVNEKAMLIKIADALPEHISANKMARVFLTACTTTPKLLECEPGSLMKAVLEASSLGLLPDGVLGHGYILPYGRKAKFIPGFRGLMDMARRSGQITRIEARAVYENDTFSFKYGINPDLDHVPAQMKGEEPGEFIAAYATATFAKTGEVVFEVMYKKDINDIRKRSPAGTSGPWVTDYIEMARKTLLRRLMKYLPLSPEVQASVASAEYADAGVLGRLMEEKIDEETGEVIDAESVGTLESLVEDVGVDEADPGLTEGTGRISTEEEERFQTAVQRLVAEAGESATPELATEMYNKMLGSYGVENIKEIRSRETRKEFYIELRAEVVAWGEEV